MNEIKAADLSILVVSYNTRDLLLRCLRSVYSSLRGLSYELIVVDNASADESADSVAREFPGVRLIRNSENRGFARANNQAMELSRGQYVLLLNSDAELMEKTANEMVSFLDEHPAAAIAGAQLLNPDGTLQGSYAGFPTLWSELMLATKLSALLPSASCPRHTPPGSFVAREVDWVSGACMMVRRSAIEAVGALDEEYFMYTEETDWCFRMRKTGWRVYHLPEAKAIHWSGKSSDRVPEEKRSRLYRSKLLFMKKHRGVLAAESYRLALYLASVAKLAGWTLAGLGPSKSGRRRARQNVRSYLALLGGL